MGCWSKGTKRTLSWDFSIFLLATTTPACGSASITNGFECGCQEAKICDHSLIDIRDLVVSGPDGHWTIDQRSLN